MRRRRALVHRLSRVLHPRPFTAAALDVPFSTACILQHMVTGDWRVGLQRQSFAPASPPSAAGAVRRGPATESRWTVNQRLGNAERELRIQFTRIAQLQAQLDS